MYYVWANLFQFTNYSFSSRRVTGDSYVNIPEELLNKQNKKEERAKKHGENVITNLKSSNNYQRQS